MQTEMFALFFCIFHLAKAPPGFIIELVPRCARARCLEAEKEKETMKSTTKTLTEGPLAKQILLVSLPLAHNGRTRSQAFFAGAASGLVEPLGALLAFALAEWVSTALPWLLSAAAGCMVCVTAQEMIPQAVEGDEPVGVVSIVLGFALMMALDVAL
jgi:hypothetical protein